MEIPDPHKTIIQTAFNKTGLDTSQEIVDFFNDCFKTLISELNITNFQTRASQTGKMFEYAFWYLMNNKYQIDLASNLEIPEACMRGAGSLDFGLFHKNVEKVPKNLVCGIEAKGSDPDSSTRPALKRTDTVKKAISQAYQFKRAFPKIPFFIVTNVMPTSGNSKCMLDLAEGDIVDKFVDIADKKELEEFIKTISNL